MPPTPPGAVTTPFDASRPWTLHPQVSLRPEAFGALAYHFGTRRLSFLKSRTLLAVVESLAGQPTGRLACLAAGVEPAELETLRTGPGHPGRVGDDLPAGGAMTVVDRPGTAAPAGWSTGSNADWTRPSASPGS